MTAVVSSGVFKPIAAISLANVNVLWTSNLGGAVVDPTVLPMPVSFAFPVSSGNLLLPAQPQSWVNGGWLTPNGSYKGFIAQCLVGPNPGVIQLTAGVTYDVWSEVNTGGGGEFPKIFVGQLPVY